MAASINSQIMETPTFWQNIGLLATQNSCPSASPDYENHPGAI
jgi:hypothetical protein